MYRDPRTRPIRHEVTTVTSELTGNGNAGIGHDFVSGRSSTINHLCLQ